MPGAEGGGVREYAFWNRDCDLRMPERTLLVFDRRGTSYVFITSSGDTLKQPAMLHHSIDFSLCRSQRTISPCTTILDSLASDQHRIHSLSGENGLCMAARCDIAAVSVCLDRGDRYELRGHLHASQPREKLKSTCV
jgi:hypothetical protein